MGCAALYSSSNTDIKPNTDTNNTDTTNTDTTNTDITTNMDVNIIINVDTDKDTQSAEQAAASALTSLSLSNTDTQSASKDDPASASPSNTDTNTKTQATSEPFNRFQGQPFAWQLGESIEDFVARLPPCTTMDFPFLMIDNPHASAQRVGVPVVSAEARHHLRRGCNVMLWALRDVELPALETGHESAMARLIKNRRAPTGREMLSRRAVMKEILNDAKQAGYTDGRWVVYVPSCMVNRAWEAVARATRDGELGTSATVGTAAIRSIPINGKVSNIHAICLHTHDFSDVYDVGRVLKGILAIFKEVGFEICKGDGEIRYWPEIYQFLGLGSPNEYGIRSTIYGSKRVLSAMNDPWAEVCDPERWHTVVELSGRRWNGY